MDKHISKSKNDADKLFAIYMEDGQIYVVSAISEDAAWRSACKEWPEISYRDLRSILEAPIDE